MVYYDVLPGSKFLSGLISTLKSKKPKKTLKTFKNLKKPKNLKTFSKKPRFFGFFHPCCLYVCLSLWVWTEKVKTASTDLR